MISYPTLWLDFEPDECILQCWENELEACNAGVLKRNLAGGGVLSSRLACGVAVVLFSSSRATSMEPLDSLLAGWRM